MAPSMRQKILKRPCRPLNRPAYRRSSMILGGGKSQPVSGKPAVKVARRAHVAQILPEMASLHWLVPLQARDIETSLGFGGLETLEGKGLQNVLKTATLAAAWRHLLVVALLSLCPYNTALDVFLQTAQVVQVKKTDCQFFWLLAVGPINGCMYPRVQRMHCPTETCVRIVFSLGPN